MYETTCASHVNSVGREVRFFLCHIDLKKKNKDKLLRYTEDTLLKYRIYSTFDMG